MLEDAFYQVKPLAAQVVLGQRKWEPKKDSLVLC